MWRDHLEIRGLVLIFKDGEGYCDNHRDIRARPSNFHLLSLADTLENHTSTSKERASLMARQNIPLDRIDMRDGVSK